MKKRLSKWLRPMKFPSDEQNTSRAMGRTYDTDRPRKLHWLNGVRFVACGQKMETTDHTEDFETWKNAGKKRCKRCEKRKPVG